MKILYAFLTSAIRSTFFAHFILLDLVAQYYFVKTINYEAHYAVLSNPLLLHPSYIYRLFANNPNLYLTFHMRDQVSHLTKQIT